MLCADVKGSMALLAERVDGGYRCTGRTSCSSLTPMWTALGLHGMDTDSCGAVGAPRGLTDGLRPRGLVQAVRLRLVGAREGAQPWDATSSIVSVMARTMTGAPGLHTRPRSPQ